MHSELPCARGASDGRWGRHNGIAILQILLHILIRGAPMPFLHIRVVVLLLGEAMDFAPLFLIPLANALAGPDHFSVEKKRCLAILRSKKASRCVLPPSAPQQARGRKDDCDDTRTIANIFDGGVFFRCAFIIQAEHNKKWHGKCRGTRWHEVVYSSERVYIVGLVVFLALDFGHCRFYEFDLQLETCSPGGC